MSNSGISTLTNAVKDKVTIYYSTSERPNENLSDASNGWKLASDIEDWTMIKTYLIILIWLQKL